MIRATLCALFSAGIALAFPLPGSDAPVASAAVSGPVAGPFNPGATLDTRQVVDVRGMVVGAAMGGHPNG